MNRKRRKKKCKKSTESPGETKLVRVSDKSVGERVARSFVLECERERERQVGSGAWRRMTCPRRLSIRNEDDSIPGRSRRWRWRRRSGGRSRGERARSARRGEQGAAAGRCAPRCGAAQQRRVSCRLGGRGPTAPSPLSRPAATPCSPPRRAHVRSPAASPPCARRLPRGERQPAAPPPVPGERARAGLGELSPPLLDFLLLAEIFSAASQHLSPFAAPRCSLD